MKKYLIRVRESSGDKLGDNNMIFILSHERSNLRIILKNADGNKIEHCYSS